MKALGITLVAIAIVLTTLGTISAIATGSIGMALLGIAMLIFNFNTLFSITD